MATSLPIIYLLCLLDSLPKIIVLFGTCMMVPSFCHIANMTSSCHIMALTSCCRIDPAQARAPGATVPSSTQLEGALPATTRMCVPINVYLNCACNCVRLALTCSQLGFCV